MNTKKIAEYRQLLGVTKEATLKELKTVYRNAMKDIHPDTIADADERHAAEEKSKLIIEGYHFLVSISPETTVKTKEEYLKTTSSSPILEFYMENHALYISFADGANYEFFGVPKNIYHKMINAESPARFAKRHIYNVYLYRSSSKIVGQE